MAAGSPPRMRGKRLNQPIRRQSRRITPADAGKTPPLSQICRHDKDHPRGCGENCPIAQPRYLGRGSPPRMRGKLRGHLATVKQNGITPADAGKTFLRAETTVLHEDHPRGCGENWLSDLWGGIKNGSPPRMRGKREKNRGAVYGIRITPADAGKTPETVMKWWMDKDHPRGCGENINWDCCQTNGAGSPPRMRGKPLCFVLFEVVNGITPADAGKTHFRSWRRRVCRDHPRGCGENAVRR